MSRRAMRRVAMVAVMVAAAGAAWPSAVGAAQVERGEVVLGSAGPMAFGEDGVLFIADPQAATIWAIHTEDNPPLPAEGPLHVEQIDRKAAALLGIEPDDLMIADMAVNPASGKVYLSVSRGRGPDAEAALIRVERDGRLELVGLEDMRHSKAVLPNAPQPPSADEASNRGRRGRRNPRMQSITDLMYVHETLYIAGLSNEEFASKLRAIAYPFGEVDAGTSIEIYHGNHGRYETRAPIRTFTAYEINRRPHLLAAYTCTPLVKIPIEQLRSGVKLVGETVAELGNRNTPLDMFVYHKGGEDWVLMSNTSRGVMKIGMAEIDRVAAITSRVGGIAGLEYETIDSLEGVEQLDKLDEQHALVVIGADDGRDLRTVALP